MLYLLNIFPSGREIYDFFSFSFRGLGRKPSIIMSHSMTIDDLEATVVFPTFWYFSSKRHSIYDKRLRGEPPPWTDDPILSENRFTNVFRAADRVSQYCIRHVIYESGGSLEDGEVIFRVILFKQFNSIGAWEALKAEVGVPSWRKFGRKTYAEILTKAKARGVKIWNPAYMQRPQCGEDYPTKHERYLAVLGRMVTDRVWDQLKAARSYAQAYAVVRWYPLFRGFSGHAGPNRHQLFPGAQF
jgi:hypothetical protein